MKDHNEKSRTTPILAAGGIVVRNDHDLAPRFAVVQSRKLQSWGLPKGKLAAGEDAMTAARREVLEETGRRVTVHEFLGTLVYETRSRPKVVQFWRMEAREPAGDLMSDVAAVDWLALADAVSRLTHLREQLFLEQVGPIALKLAERSARSARLRRHAAGNILVPGVPLAPAADVGLADEAGERAPAARAGSRRFGRDFAARFAPAAEVAIPNERDLAMQAAEAEVAAKRMNEKHPAQKSLAENAFLPGKALMKKTWGWFRRAALLHWRPLD